MQKGLPSQVVRQFLFASNATGARIGTLWAYLEKEHPGLVKSKSHLKKNILKQMHSRDEVGHVASSVCAFAAFVAIIAVYRFE